MKEIRFLWNERKNSANVKKHGINFEEAKTVFYDPNAIQYYDPDHSDDEDRFILLGVSARLHVLAACHCCGENEHAVRIISARKADRKERRSYRR